MQSADFSETIGMMMPFESMRYYWRTHLRKRFFWLLAVFAALTFLVGAAMSDDVDLSMGLVEELLGDEELFSDLLGVEYEGPDTKAYAGDDNYITPPGYFTPETDRIGMMLFWHNAAACGTALLLGLVPFLFLPILTLLANAVLLGLVGGFGWAAMGGAATMAGLWPHGIIELPAMLLSYALGLALCRTLTKAILRRPNVHPGWAIKQTIVIFAVIILPMLAAAALIESAITPVLMMEAMA